MNVQPPEAPRAGASGGDPSSFGAPSAGPYATIESSGPASVVPVPRRVDRRRAVALGGIALLFLLCGTALLLIIGYDIGPVALGVGIGAAALPVPFLVAAFMWLDRYEPEPTWALVAVFASIFLHLIGA